MKKLILVSLAALIVAGGIFTLYNWTNIQRLRYALSLFSGAEQHQSFSAIADIFPVSVVKASGQPYQFTDDKKIDLPTDFRSRNKQYNTADFLADTDTGALLILKDGKVIHEHYALSGGRDVKWLSMSVAKSFVSLAIGIAIDEDLIKSIEEPVTQYVPNLAGSAYDGVRIKDILQMSSGAAWNETYSDSDSEVLRMGKIMAFGGSLDEFLRTIKQEREPGTFRKYNSADTQVLGALLVAATGRSVTDYMQEKIWQPLGMESDAYWIVDDFGMELAFAGLNATARDYAKLGELFRNNGNWNGKQIVSPQWVKSSVTPDAPHLMPVEGLQSIFDLGYGYQWWVFDGQQGEFSAIGVYNQFIYVNPTTNLVIVKLSANSEYGTKGDAEEANKEFATIDMLRAISNSLNNNMAVVQQ
ncbi:6-aminohexanoate-dimer hydrolase [Pseudovibrio axinellae]|uniref:6-aminohexanoate-dimer hydrolase n=1 Tax=Pseudovibrio axinellae TaxID=989403 RepID=A0A165XLK0_9HYPH|nr:serine hydrolase domain-containing protein [Pseudovibrio axinellae]KZL17820.1 6-aminohexanoate-dimer hydrolase [Pseudovibrio axinellae]SEP71065.1 CubicO group peptidase, beta-lactamase class C family [Pseudovibrio axinellae]